jgi:hypothetical protein
MHALATFRRGIDAFAPQTGKFPLIILYQLYGTTLGGTKMKRFAISCGGVALALSCVAASPAGAGDNFAAGLIGGRAAGTLFGIAASSPPPVYYVAPPPPVYVPSCYWTRGRPVWGWLPRDLVQAAHSSVRLT